MESRGAAGDSPLSAGVARRVSGFKRISLCKEMSRFRISPTMINSRRLLLVPFSFLIFTCSVAFAAPFPEVSIPKDNPMSPEKISLGRQLFFDGRLSKDGSISCNSCHNVLTSGGHDGKPFSPGVGGKLGGRNSPTVWNAAFYSVQFWDGRANLLEDQAKGPMVNPVEMAMENHDVVVARLRRIPGYVEQFRKVFNSEITIDLTVKAIAAYERTLMTPDSPYDRYKGGDAKALSAAALRGLKLVEAVGCMSCHSGPHFAGPTLPVGAGFYQKFPIYPGSAYETQYGFHKDQGRYEVTKSETDRHLFRVPSWRNIEWTAPYFHNGAVGTLDEAVRVMAKTQLNRELKATEVKDIVAFLKSLTGIRPQEKKPILPPSG